jgi:hypothetical protein
MEGNWGNWGRGGDGNRRGGIVKGE